MPIKVFVGKSKQKSMSQTRLLCKNMEKCANMTRAEEAALKAYRDNEVLFFAEDAEGNNHPVTTFGREVNGFIFGYEQAEKDLIGRLAEFYPTLDYTFRGYMLQAFPELKEKIEHYD